MDVDPKDMELDAPLWTRESFAKALESHDLNVDYYGDPVDALFERVGNSLNWDEGGHEVAEEWLTVAVVETESGDRFLMERPGRLSKLDLTAELFLEAPTYYGSPDEIGFTQVRYYNFKPRGRAY